MTLAALQTTAAADPVGVAIGALLGLVLSTGFLLALFIGFIVIAGFTKFRRTRALVVRNLPDGEDEELSYLPPDAPRGPADQLRTPELLEQARTAGPEE
ncbi:MAG: hypothetical protein OXH75_19885 [Acidobacteria bacterium]|nr:hypothetical protein [Acidobacteriota bacterium]